MFNADSFPKKPLNVQDLLKYNAPQKPQSSQSSQVLRNLEKAKQPAVVQNPTTADDDSDDERIPRAAHKSQQILPAQKPTTPSTRKELVPILQKKNSEAFAATGHRLAKVEQQCRHQQEEIKAKSLLIEKLYKEASHNRKNHEQEISGLKTESNMLRNKIERMMKFMEKNNLEWNDDEGLWHMEKAYVDLPAPILNKGDENTRVQGRLPKEIDFKLIKKRIEDLNGLIEGEQDIVKGPAGAYQFRRRDPLKFIVYKDGLQIEGYPFYKYSHKDAQLVLEDILDGYFPYVLREKYPEGTPFDLINEIDRTKEQFAQSGEKKPKTRALSESPEKRLRSDFNEKIQGVLNLAGERINDGTIEVQTQNLVKELSALGPNHESIATLKIRTETGKRTILVKALNSDTIEVVYKILREHSETQAFELWGGYPPQPYPNIDGIALQDLGVSGESVFNLRPTYA